MREQSPVIRGFNQGQANANSPSTGIPTWVYVVIGLLVLAGIGVIGYKLLAPKIEKASPKTANGEVSQNKTVSGAVSQNAVMTTSNVPIVQSKDAGALAASQGYANSLVKGINVPGVGIVDIAFNLQGGIAYIVNGTALYKSGEPAFEQIKATIKSMKK